MRPRMLSALAVLGAAAAIGGATVAHAASGSTTSTTPATTASSSTSTYSSTANSGSSAGSTGSTGSTGSSGSSGSLPEHVRQWQRAEHATAQHERQLTDLARLPAAAGSLGQPQAGRRPGSARRAAAPAHIPSRIRGRRSILAVPRM